MKLRDILGVLRDSYCRTIGIEYMHIQDPEERQLDPGPDRGPARPGRPRRAAPDPDQAQRGRGVRDVPADQVRRPEALLARGRRVADPAARRGARPRRPTAGLDEAVIGMAAPRPAERAGQHRRQVLRADLPGVRGQPGPEVDARLRRREVPPRRGGRLHRARRQADQDLAGGQPEPPGGGRPGARGHRPGQAGRASTRASPASPCCRC